MEGRSGIEITEIVVNPHAAVGFPSRNLENAPGRSIAQPDFCNRPCFLAVKPSNQGVDRSNAIGKCNRVGQMRPNELTCCQSWSVGSLCLLHLVVSMKIKCPACSTVLNVPDSAAGKIVKCTCGKQLRAPGNAAPQKPATSAPAGARPGAAGQRTGQPAGASPSAGAGEFDPAMFDDLTDQDLKPVKGVVNPYSPGASPAGGGGKLLNQYAPRGGVGGKQEIASVGSRILGAIVDGIFISLFIAIGLGVLYATISPVGPEGPTGTQIYIAIAVMAVASLIPQIINAVLISKSGQSLGKKIVKTRIVDQETGVPAGLAQGFLIRDLAFRFLTGIPLVGPFILIADIIYLFMDNHQTLHDKLAKTLVVNA